MNLYVIIRPADLEAFLRNEVPTVMWWENLRANRFTLGHRVT
ncbi:hypothetical protein ASAC_0015 [Acidilobus saccharovorans 345-15]|uniref:Uncharacterized protein n=1 Tax=Acidilobus saccharovorans (strain DSM 16705 / JCM 18335 / VKM B-2471 / 345-15) TaxID=666510 RepID=D9PZD6_ACIS3|nr:hypothetical protein ASAC_0015 [Acidilobus saccharovorans 345-15]